MKGYIPKQPKQLKERMEAKLEVRLIRKLESYCQYLDSDRDYVIGQALEIAFKKDKGFEEWFGRQTETSTFEAPELSIGPRRKRGRKAVQPVTAPQSNGADTAMRAVNQVSSPSVSKGA